MKIIKISISDKKLKESEMFKWFVDRTKRHISSVRDYCYLIESLFPEFKGLYERSEGHDISKFSEPELEPYIYITWKYKCKGDGIKFECPEGMEERMEWVTEHHILNNNHHPEKWCGRTDNILNKKDRDKPPSEIIDGCSMPDMDLMEMVADWCAVGKERGTNPRDWAERNINIRWKFDDRQVGLIYKVIDKVCFVDMG